MTELVHGVPLLQLVLMGSLFSNIMKSCRYTHFADTYTVSVGFLFKLYSLIFVCFLWRNKTQGITDSSLTRSEQFRIFLLVVRAKRYSV